MRTARTSTRWILVATIGLVVGLVAAPPSAAQDAPACEERAGLVTWDGDADTNAWAEPINWSGDAVPGPGATPASRWWGPPSPSTRVSWRRWPACR